MLVRWTERFGRGGAAMPLHITGFWYALLHHDVRAASRDYLNRVFGRAGFWMVQRHMQTFARTTLDRLFFLRGRRDLFDLQFDGLERLRALKARGQGAILLGAHLGSFEAARITGEFQEFPLNILVHTANAVRINAYLGSVNPGATPRIIEIDPGDRSYIFGVQEAVERGEWVAILADRVGINDRAVQVDFLGDMAWFPAGPYVLAAALGCPVYLTFGLYHEPNRYRLYAELFSARLELPRRGRAEALQAHAQRFARRLESYVRRAPYNWFNFYQFWNVRPRGPDRPQP